MMTNPIVQALHLLGHFWLEEVRPDDVSTIAAIPELAQALPNTKADTLAELAVEYQRLFGFNLPPYESVFIDPSAMLMAPATKRVQTLYRQGQWSPPPQLRVGAPDHLGLELLALASSLEAGQIDTVVPSAGQTPPKAPDRQALAHRLLTQHLALWVPPFVLALHRLAPHPFYATLGDLTLTLILTTLPDDPIPAGSDPFPPLPPAPIYKGTVELPAGFEQGGRGARGQEDSLFLLHGPSTPQPPGADEAGGVSLRNLIKRLVSPREAGLFLTREEIAGIGRGLNSPGIMGERYRMLDTLFRFAGQYDFIPALCGQLARVLAEANSVYQIWADEYPAWTLYADAWCCRLTDTQATLEEFKL